MVDVVRQVAAAHLALPRRPLQRRAEDGCVVGADVVGGVRAQGVVAVGRCLLHLVEPVQLLTVQVSSLQQIPPAFMTVPKLFITV